MRSRRAVINTICALLAEIIAVICGFIVPRLILSTFGSSYNGITSSISQFISCVVLLRAGLGGVTRAALYKPLAEKDRYQISRIIRATEIFMQKIALIYIAMLVIFAYIYPFFVKTEFEWLFSFSLVLILGTQIFVQNYFGITYQILIQADQRKYVLSVLNIVTTILNTIVAAVLIQCGATIHIVKMGSAIVFALNPIVLNVYTRKKYQIDSSVEPDNSAIAQRWDAFAQQAAAFVNNNTDVMVLTVFCNIKEVSVYTVYHMVANGLYKLEDTITNSIEAVFGNMMAKKEDQLLQVSFRLVEFLVFITSSFLFICGGNLIVEFVEVYTRGVIDINYSRPQFGFLICINQFLFCVRLPYQMLADAAGHFRQTRNGAILESFLNVIISVAAVSQFGLIGVSIGTFVALFFRTLQYSLYVSRSILHRSMFRVVKHFVVCILDALVIKGLLSIFPIFAVTSYYLWFLYAIIVGGITAIVLLISSVLFYKEESVALTTRILNLIRK